MEGRLGGRELVDILKKLRQEIEDYLGSVNELKSGLRTQLLPKPEALTLYERSKSMGLPLVAGGLMDQPHIWIEQWSLIEGVISAFEEVARQNELLKKRYENLTTQRR